MVDSSLNRIPCKLDNKVSFDCILQCFKVNDDRTAQCLSCLTSIKVEQESIRNYVELHHNNLVIRINREKSGIIKPILIRLTLTLTTNNTPNDNLIELINSSFSEGNGYTYCKYCAYT
ncbi:8072_t:CDS:1 [Scutellospora calospora]|uniref:8072_t:CDS:1 n=1 Tax=Scutellospora calospora TaxID=85575 RepID=A0ACA9JUM8_9GLOM|nr:8072_t:CDS:1 [Scutellospora calospora]